MKFLTKDILKKLPPIYSQENVEDPIAQVKFFDPCGSFSWFATEFDGKDLFFGKVFSSFFPEGELGYFSLSEIQETKNRMGLNMERDLHFIPCPLSQITRNS